MARWLWIIAGPNGAGKSTLANQLLSDLPDHGLLKLNADERTLQLRQLFPAAGQDELNLRAAQEIDQELAACIEAGRSCMVETVLSSPKYRDDVQRAKSVGFRLGLIYVSLHPPELSPQRVSERVAKGGHTVDTAKAIERHRRSHQQLRWFAFQADLLAVYDNSAEYGAPCLLATRAEGGPLRYHARGLNPSVEEALSALENDLSSGIRP